MFTSLGIRYANRNRNDSTQGEDKDIRVPDGVGALLAWSAVERQTDNHRKLFEPKYSTLVK